MIRGDIASSNLPFLRASCILPPSPGAWVAALLLCFQGIECLLQQYFPPRHPVNRSGCNMRIHTARLFDSCFLLHVVGPLQTGLGVEGSASAGGGGYVHTLRCIIEQSLLSKTQKNRTGPRGAIHESRMFHVDSQQCKPGGNLGCP